MIPASTTRVPEHTAERINEKIRNDTERNIALYAAAGNAIINQRLKELDEEWDVERALEMNASAIALLGLLFSIAGGRRWFLLPALAAGFLMQHALQGWCPPVAILRRLGFRTRAEIDRERYAMKILRGDFQNMAKPEENAPVVAGEILNAEEK